MIRIFPLLLLLALCGHEAQATLRRVAPTSPQQVQLSFSPIVKQAAPAVVNIYTKRRVQVPSPLAQFYQDPVLRRFLGPNLQQGMTQERVVQSLGSGVVVHQNGIVVTSSHVVDGSDEIIAILNNKREYPARIILQDPDTDLALLKLEMGAEHLPFLQIASSETLEVGDMVLAIGNPFGVGQTVTSGIVSALGRPVKELAQQTPGAHGLIQTDAAINPGNSGGALVNMEGKLVGINAAIFSQTGGSHGIGFAIPAEVLVERLRQLLK